jgi:hypothetical protein
MSEHEESLGVAHAMRAAHIIMQIIAERPEAEAWPTSAEDVWSVFVVAEDHAEGGSPEIHEEAVGVRFVGNGWVGRLAPLRVILAQLRENKQAAAAEEAHAASCPGRMTVIAADIAGRYRVSAISREEVLGIEQVMSMLWG